MAESRANYDKTLRFRASGALQQRMAAVIEARGHGDFSEFIREAVTRLLEEEERRLGVQLPNAPAPTMEDRLAAIEKALQVLAGQKTNQATRAKRAA